MTGSYVNFEGRLQKVQAAVRPNLGEENWQLLSALINALNRNYKFDDLRQIRDGLAAVCPEFAAALQQDAAFVGVDGKLPQTPQGRPALPDNPGLAQAAFAREYEEASTSVKSWQKMKV